MVLGNKNAGIFKIKIEIGQYFEANESDFWIELREPTTQEALGMKSFGGSEGHESEMFAIMPSMIIDHNFESEPNKKMSKDDVWEEIMKRSSCSVDIVQRWSENIPLAKKKLEK